MFNHTYIITLDMNAHCFVVTDESGRECGRFKTRYMAERCVQQERDYDEIAELLAVKRY